MSKYETKDLEKFNEECVKAWWILVSALKNYEGLVCKDYHKRAAAINRRLMGLTGSMATELCDRLGLVNEDHEEHKVLSY